MDALPPIPTPPSLRWREFRISLLPIITFLMTLGAIVWLWKLYIHPASIIGEVEQSRANVISTVAGTIRELKVTRFQRVTNGQVLAVISTMDADAIKAELAVIDADLKVTRARMELDVWRNRGSYFNMRFDYLKDQTDLAISRVALQFAELAFQRADELIRAKPVPLISTNEYDTLRKERDVLLTTVQERGKYVAQKERELPPLDPVPAEKAILDDTIALAISAQQEQLRQLEDLQNLKSPIDGMVSLMAVQQGSKITPGLPLMVVSADKAQRIVAWMRQPISVRPEPGDKVTVRRHSFQMEVEESVVVEVGAQLEPITPGLIPSTTGNPNVIELGLPFAIKIPEKLNLIPGEAIEIVLRSKAGR